MCPIAAFTEVYYPFIIRLIIDEFLNPMKGERKKDKWNFNMRSSIIL